MPRKKSSPIAEAKGDGEPTRAPLRLMTQFLRAVSESRMEDALALAQTILTFEPQNAIILDYKATLARYINNERDLAKARDEDDSDDGDGGDSTSSGQEPSSTSTGSDDDSTEETSGEESPEGGRGIPVAAPSNGSAHGADVKKQRRGSDERELQRLGGILRDLRDTRVAESQEIASRWDEDKFAAPRREVEQVLWQFLPEEAKQAARKRAEDDVPNLQQRTRLHKQLASSRT
eukprot:g5707.t2